MKEFTPGSKELAGMKANIRQLPTFAKRFINPPIVRSAAPTPVEMLVNSQVRAEAAGLAADKAEQRRIIAGIPGRSSHPRSAAVTGGYG
jgi:hypothetical protein